MPNLPVAKYNDRYSLSTFSFAKSGSYGVEGTCHHKSNLGHVIMLEVEWVLSHFPIESIILHHCHKNAFGVYSRSCSWNANVINTLSMERRKNFECWIFPNCILTAQSPQMPHNNSWINSHTSQAQRHGMEPDFICLIKGIGFK